MRLALLVLAGLLLVSCGTTDGDVALGPTAEEAGAPSSTTVVPDPGAVAATSTTTPAVRQPTGGVVLAGDSIAGEVAPALGEALADDPRSFHYVAQPNLADSPTLLAEWEGRLAELDPTAVVLLLGTWERLAVDTSQPGWQDPYVESVIAPLVQLLVANGTEVVFAAYPPLEDQADAPGDGGLNDLWASLPERLPGTSFVDAGGAVRAADGGFTETVPVPGVGELRIRQSDGRHLCPDGVMLVADPIVEHLQAAHEVVPREGWQRGPWRFDPDGFEHPELCPGSF